MKNFGENQIQKNANSSSSDSDLDELKQLIKKDADNEKKGPHHRQNQFITPHLVNTNSEATSCEEEVKDGINDLMNLPKELIEMELIKRKYYPPVVKRTPHWYNASILRDSSEPVVTDTNPTKPLFPHSSFHDDKSINPSANQTIFDDDSETIMARYHAEMKSQKPCPEEEEAKEFDPDDFA